MRNDHDSDLIHHSKWVRNTYTHLNFRSACKSSPFNKSLLVTWRHYKILKNEPADDETYKMACALREDSDQPRY